jgi:hypothetical protein
MTTGLLVEQLPGWIGYEETNTKADVARMGGIVIALTYSIVSATSLRKQTRSGE